MKTDAQILRLAVPSIVSNITVPLLGLVDLAIVGHMGDTAYIGAIAVGSMIFNVMYWLFGFLRMGTSGLTSQALGARDLPRVIQLLLLSMLVSLSVAGLLVVLQYPLRCISVMLMHPSATVGQLVHTYFNICIWGAPAMLGLYSVTGWFIGMQNTRIPMWVAMMQNVVNVLVSLTLVYGCGMKVEGVALGTFTAQWFGLFMALGLWWRYYRRLAVYAKGRSMRLLPSLRRFFTVNRDIFLRTLFLVAVNLFFTSAGARQGDLILSVNTLLLTLFTLTSFVMDGFAYAGEALGGRCYGAANRKTFEETKRRLFFWGVLVALLFTCAFAFGGESLLGLLTDETNVVEAAMSYLPWAVAIPFVGMSAFLYDGLFIGMTATRGMLISSAISACCFFSAFYLLFGLIGNHALWLALLLYLGMRGAIQAYYMRTYLQF